jgi:hypothetical protein
VLGEMHGIGPNQRGAASDLLVNAVQKRTPGVRTISAEQILAGDHPRHDGPGWRPETAGK